MAIAAQILDQYRSNPTRQPTLTWAQSSPRPTTNDATPAEQRATKELHICRHKPNQRFDTLGEECVSHLYCAVADSQFNVLVQEADRPG